jgi:heavy metal translocating P-type ATPase
VASTQPIPAAPPEVPNRPSLRCELAHSCHGRLRIRVEQQDVFARLGVTIESVLAEIRGVREVRLNRSAQSVIITYDPAIVTAEHLLRTIRALTVEHLEATIASSGACPRDDESSSWWSLGLSSIAVGLCAFTEFPFTPWLLGAAAVPIFARAGRAIAQRGTLNVDVLDAAATTVLAARRQLLTAAAMVWLVSLGDFLRDSTVQQSHRAIEELFDDHRQTAWVMRDGSKRKVRTDELREGDEVVVYAGGYVPVDGIVVDGYGLVEQKILTGESMPVEKSPGAKVYAGTVVSEGKVYVRATGVGRQTTAAKIVQLVRHAPVRETRIQNYAEAFADRVVPWSFLGAGGALAIGAGAEPAASLLIIDYGTGIRMAAPTTVLASITKAARQGILIKGGRALERLADVDTVVFDKTGTLTLGRPEVVDIIPHGSASAEEVLTLAAAAEQRFTHPIARAIVRAARDRGLAIPERERSTYAIGLGVEATVGQRTVHTGCERFMRTEGVDIRQTESALARLDGASVSPVFIAVDRELVGLLVYADPQEAPGVVQALRDRGIGEVAMLTGDRPAVARRVARNLGIDRHLAEVLPAEKLEFIKALQDAGRTVAMVGDGVNDSAALAQADVGIAVRGGVDIARETAHVVLLEGNLWKIPRAVDIARESMGLIRQNWDLVFYPNTLALALALGGFIGPVGATLISNGSGIAAGLNALRPLLDR